LTAIAPKVSLKKLVESAKPSGQNYRNQIDSQGLFILYYHQPTFSRTRLALHV
jgi:hypothetical protein